jgi:hypothetical protein
MRHTRRAEKPRATIDAANCRTATVLAEARAVKISAVTLAPVIWQ